MIERRMQAGFSLLEVLVAFTILALSLGVLFNIFASGVRGAIVSERYNQAVIVAESRLALLGTETPLEAGESQGQAREPFRWRVRVTPYPEGGAEQTQRAILKVKPFRVDVWVRWEEDGKAREIEVSTLRLARVSRL